MATDCTNPDARDVLVRAHVLTGQVLGAVIGQQSGDVADELPSAPAHLRPGIDAVTGFVERTAARDLADPQDQQTLRTAIAAMRAS